MIDSSYPFMPEVVKFIETYFIIIIFIFLIPNKIIILLLLQWHGFQPYDPLVVLINHYLYDIVYLLHFDVLMLEDCHKLFVFPVLTTIIIFHIIWFGLISL